MNGDNIDTCAERIANVQRAIMAREGRKLPQDDFPPEVNFTEPLTPGPPRMVPGPGDLDRELRRRGGSAP